MKIILLSFAVFLAFVSEAMAAAKNDCSGLNHPNYQDEYRACLRIQIAEQASEAGVDCVDCLFEQEQKQPANWVQALAAVAQPLAYLGSAYVTAKYQYKSQEAWASAYSNGFSQCTNRFNSYLNYSTEMGANPLSATEAQSLMNTCNGSPYSAYSGYSGMMGNGYGGFSNPMISSGYSGGFVGGMVGPYFGGGYSSGYGMGMGAGVYGGMYSGMYGNTGMGMYGNIGMGMPSASLNYGAAYPGVYGAGMGYAGMGVIPMYSGGNIYGSSPYAAGNLNAGFSLSAGGSAGFSF